MSLGILLATLLAACGGDVGLTTQAPATSPTVTSLQVSGTVRMPNGRVAALSGSVFDRLARLAVSAAAALTGNVSPVGGGVTVTLGRQESDGVSVSGPLGSATTNARGQYTLTLPDTSDPANVCRYVVWVGDQSNGTLTRAFLISASHVQDIDFATEAAVRLILQRVGFGAPLCNFSAREIGDLVAAIRALPGDVSGSNADEVNGNASDAASQDPGITQLLDADAGEPGPPTMTPRNTLTATATETFTPPPPTATRTQTGTPDFTAIPTRTFTPTMTRTFTQTATPATTPPPTPTPSATLSPTPTFLPTATATVTPTPSTTLSATPSATITATPSATITATPIPTLTATPSFTVTPTPSVTLTATPSATITLTPSATVTPTPSASSTATSSPTISATPSPTTPQPSATITPTPSPTTPQPSATVTPTPSASLTATPSASITATPSASVTATPSPSLTATPSPTITPTSSPTTPQPSFTSSPTRSATALPPTATMTPTPSPTPPPPSPTITPTPTHPLPTPTTPSPVATTKPSTLYAATRGGGVFKSTDSGGSWNAVNAGLSDPVVNALAINPITPSTLYAGSSDGGVFKSTNGGSSWTAVNTGLKPPPATLTPTPKTEVLALAIDPTTPSTLYAAIGGSGGVFKSTDGASTWTAVNSGLNPASINVRAALAIDPARSNTLYAGTHGSGVFLSTDGGGHWTAFNAAPTATATLSPTPTSSPTATKTATRTLSPTLQPTKTFTPTKTVPPTKTFTPVTPTLTASATVSSTPTPTVVGELNRTCTFHTGTSFSVVKIKSTLGINLNVLLSGSQFWNFSTMDANGVRTVRIPAGGTHFDPVTVLGGLAKVCVRAAVDGTGVLDCDGGEAAYDNAAVWDHNTTDPPGPNGGLPQDPTCSATFNLPGNQMTSAKLEGDGSGAFKSPDGGSNWSAINSGLTNPVVFALALDPTTPSTLYAGTSRGGVFKSTDGGGTWNAANAGLPANDVLALAVEPAPATPRPTPAATATLPPTGTGLTGAAVNALAINPTTPSTLYAGTNDGVFRSTDGGSNWSQINQGLTNSAVNALAINPTMPSTVYEVGTNDLHPGICNSPLEFIESGNFVAGGMKLQETLAARILTGDHTSDPCPADTTPLDRDAGDISLTGVVTSGTVTGTVYDAMANTDPWQLTQNHCSTTTAQSCALDANCPVNETCIIANLTNTVVGTPFGCANIENNVMSAGKLAVSIPAIDLSLATFGNADIVATLQLVCQ